MTNNKLLCTLHVMWYEHLMITETLDSIQAAMDNAVEPVDLIICLNSQTYIEKPDPGFNPDTMFDTFLNHTVLKNATILRKTDNDPFYNIGDWARDIFGPTYDYKYIVWGESDCLVPEDYFFLLQNIDIDYPHAISLSTRKMWDSTWDELEHPYVQQIPRTGPIEEPQKNTPFPFAAGDYISQSELNDFNNKYDPILIQLQTQKIDGCMTAIPRNFPIDFLHIDLHIGGHDHYVELYMKKHNIPQLHISTRLKGHNCTHPNKRIGTSTTRGSAEYLFYKQQCDILINKLIQN
jgi:hypothetical protein